MAVRKRARRDTQDSKIAGTLVKGAETSSKSLHFLPATGKNWKGPPRQTTRGRGATMSRQYRQTGNITSRTRVSRGRVFGGRHRKDDRTTASRRLGAYSGGEIEKILVGLGKSRGYRGTKKRKISTPAQDTLRSKIQECESQLNFEIAKRDAGFGDEDNRRIIKKLKLDLETQKSKLKSLQQNAERQKIFRNERNSQLKLICEENKNNAQILKIREQPGRPRIEIDQPEIFKSIVEIASHNASADVRRRSETIRACKTLDQLREQLSEAGFNLSRTATYLRLLPRSSRSLEGKRHVATVPVKLSRPQADLHKSHVDQNFCMATIRSLECLASILGPNQVAFISQDDKARVPIGKTAAKVQAPLLMHLQYRVSLPDHDWVIAGGHKLIPSVYTGIVIKPDGQGETKDVSYSGPTYIAIRSGKHSSSAAATHANDLERLLDLDSFQIIMKNSINGIPKPIWMLSVDGGPDENPRYEKVIAQGIKHFKDHDLDALFIFTNAPGRSAFNRVERRMAPLSRELSGLILPYDHFGSHLNDQGKTIDNELEIKNFEHAGNVLCDVWNRMEIDGYSVHAEYISSLSTASVLSVDLPNSNWYCRHVFESQYCLQIVKCGRSECCTEFRSNLKSLLPDGHLPPPYPLKMTDSGLTIPPPNDKTEFKFAPLLLRLSLNMKPESSQFSILPYDFYCPSIQADLASRICQFCGFYTSSKKGALKHRKNVHPRGAPLETSRIRPQRVIARRGRELLCQLESPFTEETEWIDIESVDNDCILLENDSVLDSKDCIPIVKNVGDWLNTPWTDDIM
ncbi:uncharacterized protein [Neodiprion pinetum]|uniref:uncharacterized protein n=1 Tax=Neodiprion pinetum TaxID=441929 RepID=UPI001EE0FE29|nr:uncharacterized protein LOC124212784 isoform X1 [Neodiprion pinetum]XP_046469186.1 uncharacterized protein LOC124212784 isoform X1 [Neodiprion pinetum]